MRKTRSDDAMGGNPSHDVGCVGYDLLGRVRCCSSALQTIRRRWPAKTPTGVMFLIASHSSAHRHEATHFASGCHECMRCLRKLIQISRLYFGATYSSTDFLIRLDDHRRFCHELAGTLVLPQNELTWVATTHEKKSSRAASTRCKFALLFPADQAKASGLPLGRAELEE